MKTEKKKKEKENGTGNVVCVTETDSVTPGRTSDQKANGKVFRFAHAL